MKTKFEEIVNVQDIGKHVTPDLNDILVKALRESFSPSYKDKVKRLVVVIDNQNDFNEGGSFAVPGSAKDTERLCRFIYNNMHGITRIMSSKDAHAYWQITHGCWWEDKNGNHPDPFSIITFKDYCDGKWIPIVAPEISEMVLEEAGEITIWPYHCLRNTVGYSLEYEYLKMVHFHSYVRKVTNMVIHKGEDPFGDMLGFIRQEFGIDKSINTVVLDELEKYDEIYFAGQAASHCATKSAMQVIEERPHLASRITILKDCMSPVQGFEEKTLEVYEELKRKGAKVSNSTDIHFNDFWDSFEKYLK